ncbi:MAG: ribosomal L7Ae/L30e/S12e/Gadd45 family protein [Lachnospiraceae bacterium]|nr:ribosomal L7Ae/L30e/S12e/Gadd45 family protein [Lachnospiraceae bacterium]
MTEKQRALHLLGLATKAGKTAGGELAALKAIKGGKAKLVIVAADASGNTREMFSNKCTYYHVPICFLGTKSELGAATGKDTRASLAILDAGLAGAITKSAKGGVEDADQ